MRKYILVILLLAGLAGNAFSQNWLSDLNTAMQTAKDSNKNILLLFHGSDWCAPCIKLDRMVFETSEFEEYADANLVLLEADFPRRKKNALPEEQMEKNNALAEKYNTEGYFPLVVILTPEGEVIAKTGYKDITVTEYIEHLKRLMS